MKPTRNDEGKGRGMQLKGPRGKGSVSELKSASSPVYLHQDSPRPGPSQGSQKPASPLQPAADHLEEELDLLLSLDAPIKEGGNVSPDQTSQSLESEKDGSVAQEETGMAFVMFLIHFLDLGVFGRAVPSYRYMSPSVSDIDLALSTDIYFCAQSPFIPELTFLIVFLSVDLSSFQHCYLLDCNIKPGAAN